jgi:outer membrane phospholipase A
MAKEWIKFSQKRIENISIPQRIIGDNSKLLDFYKTKYINRLNNNVNMYYSIEYREYAMGETKFVLSYKSKDFLAMLSDAEKIKLAFTKKQWVEKNDKLQEL